MSQRRILEPKLSWQYMACLTDGEGHIKIGKQIAITWAQAAKNAFWLDHIVDFLEGEGVTVYDGSYTYGDNSFRVLTVGAIASVRQCLESMRPWLILKAQRADDALSELDRRQTAKKTKAATCSKGHPRTVSNTWVSPTTGRRMCRPCRTDRQRTTRQSAK